MMHSFSIVLSVHLNKSSFKLFLYEHKGVQAKNYFGNNFLWKSLHGSLMIKEHWPKMDDAYLQTICSLKNLNIMTLKELNVRGPS